ncbi:MAG: hypothetical protein HC842_09285 [Cytophagales bacterium]|nr:hypothetical protein [Cytophagales bacterium]
MIRLLFLVLVPHQKNTFSVFVTENLSCGASAATAVAISIVNTPNAPVVTGASSYCVGAVATNLSVSSGTDIRWFSDAGLTNQIGSGNSLAPSAIPGFSTAIPAVFQVFATENLSCGASAATQFTITINNVATPPVVSGATAYCVGDVASNLTVTGGTDIRWYEDAALTNQLGAGSTFDPNNIPGFTTAAAGSFTVYVTENLSCGASAATSVTIQIGNTPNPPLVSGATSYCVGDAVTNLSVPGGTDIRWYSDGGIDLSDRGGH